MRQILPTLQPEQRGEKEKYQGKNEEINSDMRHSEDSNRSHKTREEEQVKRLSLEIGGVLYNKAQLVEN